MKNNYEILASVSLATSLALGATACGGSPPKSEGLKCVGLEFASPKGGPGAIQMRVFPNFARNFSDARPMTVSGKVVKGNDAGSTIETPADGNAYGQFTFTWDEHSSDVQTSTIHADVHFEGKDFTCPDTKMQFDPTNYKVTPHLTNSPY